MEAVLWGGVVRCVQAVAEGAPTLLVGLIVAGVLRRLVGAEATRRLFGGGAVRGLLQSWGMGMVLPVCSLGAIPVAYEMRRAGVSGGAVLAFLLTAPLFNPLSLLYGLTLAAPWVIVTFAFCSLLLVTILGFAWHRFFGVRAERCPADCPVAPGIKRMLAVVVAAARYAAGPTLPYCVVAAAGTVVLNFMLPKGSLGTAFAHQDPTSPLLMLGIAPLAYATPLTVMMQIGSMFVHGNSVGAAYTLLAIGAGVNLGTIVWIWLAYGGRATAAFLAVLACSVLAIAYAIEDPLYAGGNVPRPHTHAFDIYACPFDAQAAVSSNEVLRILREAFQPYQTIALVLLAGLVATGCVLNTWDHLGRVESLLQRPRAAGSRSLDIPIPAPILGVLALSGLVLASGVGCYVYYPPPADTMEDMVMAKVDCFAAVYACDRAAAFKSIAAYDELTRKLQVGYVMRHWELDEFQQARAQVLRGRLEQLKDLVEAGEFDDAKQVTLRVDDAHRRCREAFGLAVTGL